VRLALGLLAALLFLALTFNPVVDGDGVGYYSYLHSIVVDHDLDLADEYSAARAAGATVLHADTRTRTGLLADYYPVGSALLALPFYAVAQVARQDQYGRANQAAYCLASLLAGLLALVICYRITRSPVAVFAACFATPFAFYLVAAPSYSHTFSALAVSLFVWAWLRGRSMLLLGFLGGLMALVRPQDGALMAVALLDLPRVRWRVLLLVPGALVAFAPQLWVDQVIFGQWQPPSPPEGFRLWPGHYWQVLFSTWRGLFVWHPVTLAAVAGFIWVKGWRLRLAMAFSLLFETAINGAVGDWWGGLAFGQRRFLDLLPYFAIGLAALAERLRPALAWAAAGLLTAWNFVLWANFIYVIHADTDPGLKLITGQLRALLYVPRLFGQGYVLRHGDLLLLALEAACLAVAFNLAHGHGEQASPQRDDARLQRGADP